MVNDDMTIDQWQSEVQPIRDWVPDRFRIHGSSDGGSFGWTKGSFGIFCADVDSDIGRIEVAALTHLNTGMRIFCFDTPESASVAGDLAERVGDWSLLTQEGLGEDWQSRAVQMYDLWRSAGLVCTPIKVMGRCLWAANVAQNKPQH